MSKEKIPSNMKSIYDTFYKKISDIINKDDKIFDIKKDPMVLKQLIELSMATVEKLKDMSGENKKKQAIWMLKIVIKDLKEKNKIDADAADEIITNIDFWGGIVMDVAIDAIKGAFDIGQEFIEDLREEGCKSACMQNCFIC